MNGLDLCKIAESLTDTDYYPKVGFAPGFRRESAI
jgi:hypothetical protein